MGCYDTIDEMPEGYDNQVKCWDCNGAHYKVGDTVPELDGQKFYSVMLNTWNNLPPRYLHIDQCIIRKIGATQPLPDAPVYDKWGYRCVGNESPGKREILGWMNDIVNQYRDNF